MRKLLSRPPQASRQESRSCCLKAVRGDEGRGWGARRSHGSTSWGRVSSEPSCPLRGSSRAERGVSISSLGFYALLLLLSADLFGGRSCRGAANNGCSHFPVVRYLMTLTPQPPILFIYLFNLFFSLRHSQLKCCQQPA